MLQADPKIIYILRFSVNLVAYNVVVILLFISHTRAVFSDPGIVALPCHQIDFSDAHHQNANGSKGHKTESNSGSSGLLTNQTPPDEGNKQKFLAHQTLHKVMVKPSIIINNKVE